MQKLLNKREAASLLAVSIRTLDRMRSTGEIQAVMVRGAVRFHPSVIETFIARQTAKR